MIDDRNGNKTIGTTKTLGGGMQTPSANVNMAVQIISVRTVDQLGGTFGYGGLAAQEVFHSGWNSGETALTHPAGSSWAENTI